MKEVDLAWKILGVYESATVGQILEGGNIYRGIEAHTITVLAVYTLFMQVFLTLFDIERGHDAPPPPPRRNVFNHCAQILRKRKLKLGNL